MKDLTLKDFPAMVGNTSGVVLLDFWAERCGPCMMLKPQLEQLSKDYAGKAEFYKVDTDVEGELSMQFSIRSIPTVIIFKNGEVKEKIVGVQSIETYKEKLNQLIAST